MATRLQNLSREPRTYILCAPGAFNERLPKHRQTVITEVYDPKTGERSTRAAKRRFPASISLQPKGVEGDVIDGLPEQVSAVPEIQRDVKSGILALFTSTPAPDPTPSPNTQPDPAPAAPPTTPPDAAPEPAFEEG